MESDKSPHGEPYKPKGSAQSLSNYLGGEVTTISEGENDEEHPGAGQTHMMSRFGGAAAGAALAGAAVAAAGLPMATVGAGAAVAGAVVGAVAGRAVSKEWVRGEVVADAMEFDQDDGPKADEAARDEAGANTVQAARADDDMNKDKAHIFSVGGHHGHSDNRKA